MAKSTFFMKKIKIMLASLAILSIVGGTLAFKARYVQDWCSTTAVVGANGSTCVVGGNRIDCPLDAPNSTTITPDTDASFYCTTLKFGNGFTCTSLDENENIITTTCGAPTFTTISKNF
jgi:hypothetical protein